MAKMTFTFTIPLQASIAIEAFDMDDAMEQLSNIEDLEAEINSIDYDIDLEYPAAVEVGGKTTDLYVCSQSHKLAND